MHGNINTMDSTRSKPVPASFPLGRLWFVAATFSKNEFRAEQAIKALGFDAYAPRSQHIKKIRGRKVHADHALFPGYIFAAFDLEKDDWPEINGCDGVLEILSNNDIPSRVNSVVIDRLRRAEDAGLFDYTKPSASFAVGDTVEIQGGSFAGLLGKIKNANGKKRIKILLNLLGAIDIDAAMLRVVR